VGWVRWFAAGLGLALVLSGCDPASGGHRHTVLSSAPARSAGPPSGSSASVPARPAAGSPSGGAASATPGGTAAAPPAGARTVTVLGSGDVLVHPALWQQAAADARAGGGSGYDFGPIFAGVAPITRAVDLATCELETPLAPPQGPFAGWPDFDAPPQVLTALTGAGYDTCTTASNHTLDQGYAGVRRTLDELDAAGLQHTGSARSADEAARPLIRTTGNGVRIAQLAYAFGFNGHSVPAAQPWLANTIDVPAILAAAHRARQAGADIVVLSMHWGLEYHHDPSAEQAALAEELLASPDVDLILGAHAHVVQPFQRLHGKWVVYCMGNQISRHEVPTTDSREGVMPRVTFTEVAPHHFVAGRVEAIPTLMEIAPRLRLVALRPAIADPQTSDTARAGYRAALARITGHLNSLGARQDGLIIS